MSKMKGIFLTTRLVNARFSKASHLPTIVISGRLVRGYAGSSDASLPSLPIFKSLTSHPKDSVAIVESHDAKSFTYGQLARDVAATKAFLQKRDGLKKGVRVGVIAENGYEYVVSMLAVWAAGGIFVPLCTTHPKPEISYALNNSGCRFVIMQNRFKDKIEWAGRDMLVIGKEIQVKHPKAPDEVEIHDEGLSIESPGMILYTSGTTNLPKGVLTTHRTITAQANSLTDAWKYSYLDHVLHVLPLHHIHGIVNGLVTPLFAGSTVEFLGSFHAEKVWKRLLLGHTMHDDELPHQQPITMFHGVPTMYKSLTNVFGQLPKGTQPSAAEAASALRLAICGSAALPLSLANSWTSITGTPLLERYGMTEIGMALSCGIPAETRLTGSVGWPMPGVQCRLVDDEGDEIEGHGREGDLQVAGDTVFSGYWEKPEITESEFVVEKKDGKEIRWFKTGDAAARGIDGEYYIKGRRSVDILKVGGEKVSALEVEREILELPFVAEVAVLGIPSTHWGQTVAAVIVISSADQELAKKKPRPTSSETPPESFSRGSAREFLKNRLAAWKVPRIWRVVDSIPRNAMGKVNKKSLVKEVFPDIHDADEMDHSTEVTFHG